ncbi:MAG: T9SS type A sorting domain-containing protein, partial [Flavobacteriales bacterium]|nr:T9SS type A sorting domain-containing protein [Flavobacteriales bacterium]
EITPNEVKIWTIDNYIQMEFLDTKKYTEVEIRDLSGKLIFSKNIANSTYEKVNTANWSEAVYLVTLLNDKGSKKVKKVIIN